MAVASFNPWPKARMFAVRVQDILAFGPGLNGETKLALRRVTATTVRTASSQNAVPGRPE